jgi:hypothetical protein
MKLTILVIVIVAKIKNKIIIIINNVNVVMHYFIYTACFTTLGQNCRR